MRQGYKFIRESGCEHDDDYLSHLFNDIFCWTNGTYKLCYTHPDMEDKTFKRNNSEICCG